MRALILALLLVVPGCGMETKRGSGTTGTGTSAQQSYTCGKCGGTYMQPQNCPKCGDALTPVGTQQPSSTPPRKR
jgi:hypothetical protein